MHKRFLEGHDSRFGVDYDQIDADESLDDRKLLEQDHEDKYFDSEEQSASSTAEGSSVYTGVLDYW